MLDPFDWIVGFFIDCASWIYEGRTRRQLISIARGVLLGAAAVVVVVYITRR